MRQSVVEKRALDGRCGSDCFVRLASWTLRGGKTIELSYAAFWRVGEFGLC